MNLLQNDSDYLAESYRESGNIDLSRFFICCCGEALLITSLQSFVTNCFLKQRFYDKKRYKTVFFIGETHSDSFPGGACVDAPNLRKRYI